MKSTEGRENDQILVPLTPESPDDAFTQPRPPSLRLSILDFDVVRAIRKVRCAHPPTAEGVLAQPRRNRGALPFKFGDEGGPDSALRV